MTATLILNGFDRCGSSMISRVLSEHPQVELIFQPFNSTNVRRRMYEVWDDSVATPEDVRFLEGLQEGRLDEGYIVSGWHARHSTTREIVPGHLHVVKTTLNHLTARWMAERFPGVGMGGIWRDPMGILSSVLRNGFFREWYGDEAVRDLAATAAAHPEEFGAYAGLRPRADSDAEKTAYLIGARSYFLFRHLDPARVVVYERVRRDPNAELGRLLALFGLEAFDFSPFVRRDYNVIGEAFREGGREAPFPEEERGALEALFAPLRELAEARLGVRPGAETGASR